MENKTVNIKWQEIVRTVGYTFEFNCPHCKVSINNADLGISIVDDWDDMYLCHCPNCNGTLTLSF